MMKPVMIAMMTLAFFVQAGVSQELRNYTFIYFENGYPTRLKGGRRPQRDANVAARKNPDLVIQTGFYSLRLDCDDMQLTGYDALQGSDYLAALNEDVTVFSPAELLLTLEKDGVEYRCVSGVVQDKGRQYIRLIESGQYVQRFDHLGLVFEAKNGDVLEKAGRFEVTAWPDHVVFRLDFSDVPGVKKTEITLTSSAGKVHQASARANQAVLILQPHLDREYQPLKVSDYFRSASNLKTGVKLDGQFDEDEAGLRIDLQFAEGKSSSTQDRLDEFVIEVKNYSNRPRSIPLIFNETKVIGITGTSMLLCEEKDGRPIGIPVQISKNWHNEAGKRVVHDGPWLRGYTMIPLRGKETKTFRLRVVTGYWGGVPAVSYSQLSVIGYGGNWKWDESALGAWGESMCYDPSQHLGGAFITDVRPSLVTGKNGKSHDWTENAGGGDFLVYFDRDGVYRWGKKLKTAYHWTGPNMTEVFYSGITDDDKIRFNYRVRSVRTADYHRRFHAYKYEFLEDVDSPERLIFHQMAADHYNLAKFEKFHVGDRSGLEGSYECKTGSKGYEGSSIPFKNSWLAIEDTTHSNGSTALAGRGILSLSAKLRGFTLPLSLYPYSPNGRSVSFDLAAKSAGQSYRRRGVVEGELEFIMPPQKAGNYWGEDSEFKSRLETYKASVWQAVADEYRHNVQMKPVAHVGELIKNYPIEVRAASGEVLAELTIPRGGIGHVPIIVYDVPGGRFLRTEYFMEDGWLPIGPESAYQGVRNAKGMLDCVFNIARPVTDLDCGWRIRILQSAE